MTKKLLSILLCLAMLVSLTPAALAGDIEIEATEPESAESPEEIVLEQPADGEEAEALPLEPDEPVFDPNATVVETGSCGDNATYTFFSDGRLLITGVGAIKENAFSSFSGTITSVQIGLGITKIGRYAFDGCGSISAAELPNTLTTIGYGAFRNCSSLTSIVIPASVKEYDGPSYNTTSIFAGCVSLQKAEIHAASIGSRMFDGCSSLTSLTIGSEVTKISAEAFRDCVSLKTVTIPGSVTSIGNYAFQHCNRLKTLNLTTGLKTIGDYAFQDCAYLAALVLPESCEAVGGYAFADCLKLVSVSFPSTLTSLGYSAFQGCVKLASVTVPANVTVFDGPSYNSTCIFAGCTALTRAEIHTPTIGSRMFDGCTALTELVIGSEVTKIGTRAFSDCTALQTVTIPGTVTVIGDYAFQHCSGLVSLKLKSGLVEIQNYSFEQCTSLASLTLPDSVTALGNYCFSACSALSAVKLSAGLVSMGECCFSSCIALTAITIPSSLKTYSGPSYNSAGFFRDCTQLASVTLEDGVLAVWSGMFRGCTSLVSVTLPDSVTKIGSNAFTDCAALSEITIPDSVTEIGGSAFYNCGSLRNIFFRGDAPNTIGNNAFYRVTADAWYYEDADYWDEDIMKNYGGTITWHAMPHIEAPALKLKGQSTLGVKLKWSKTDGAQEYRLQRDGGFGWELLGSFTDRDTTDKDALMGVSYRYRVCAIVNGVQSDYSAPLTVLYNPFVDVSGAKTIEYVAWAFNNGIVNGTSTITFSPNANCTRIQFVMMLWKMHGSPEVEGTNPFSDVVGIKSSKAIVWALNQGIINSGKKFDPDGNISRIQIVMMLWKLAGSPEVSGKNPFTDVSGSKTTKAVLWAYRNGITKGTSATEFSPNKDCTRVQLVIFLYKYNNIYHVI